MQVTSVTILQENAGEKNNNANQYEFPDLRIRDRQFGPRYESGRGAKAQQPDRHHRTGHRQIRPSPTPQAEHSTQRIPDSQRNPQYQRHTHNRHSHRLRRYYGEQVIKQLSSIPGFVEASTVPGQFDIVALWQAKTSEEIVKTSVERVSHLDGIFKSETILAYTPVFKA